VKIPQNFDLKRLKFELELSFFFSKPRNAREILDTTCAPACKRCVLASFTSRPAHAAPWSRQSTAPNNRGFRTIWLRYVLRKHPANAIPEILLAYPPHCPFRVSCFQCTPSRKALASPRLEIESRYTWRRRPFALSLTPPPLSSPASSKPHSPTTCGGSPRFATRRTSRRAVGTNTSWGRSRKKASSRTSFLGKPGKPCVRRASADAMWCRYDTNPLCVDHQVCSHATFGGFPERKYARKPSTSPLSRERRVPMDVFSFFFHQALRFPFFASVCRGVVS